MNEWHGFKGGWSGWPGWSVPLWLLLAIGGAGVGGATILTIVIIGGLCMASEQKYHDSNCYRAMDAKRQGKTSVYKAGTSDAEKEYWDDAVFIDDDK